jgi:hypothetical protein
MIGRKAYEMTVITKKIKTYVSLRNFNLSSRKFIVPKEVGFSLGNNHVFMKNEFKLP